MRKPSWTATPHPLAVTLEQSNLKLIDEEHSITDRLRTDIDEGKEVKDAMLLLRRAEIHRLDSIRGVVTAERDELRRELELSRSELEQARQQISIQTAHAEALQDSIVGLERQLTYSNGDLHRQIQDLSKALTEARLHEQTRLHNENDGLNYAMNVAGASDAQSVESALLIQTIDRQQCEIEKWKAEALGRGNDAVSRSWQASVDEAVRREREKDSFVIRSLREELERLKAG